MNDQITELLKQLSTKFGTTAEHLWAAMLRQAPVSSATDLAVLVIMFCFIAFAFRFIQKSDWDHEGKIVGFVVLSIITVIFSLIACSEVDIIIAGFFNPEYWALKKFIK